VKTIVRFPTGILLIVISVLGLSWFSWAQAAGIKQAVAPLAETVSGQVSLCQTSGDVIAKLQLKGLKPGNAYTVWLVYVARLSPLMAAASPPSHSTCRYVSSVLTQRSDFDRRLVHWAPPATGRLGSYGSVTFISRDGLPCSGPWLGAGFSGSIQSPLFRLIDGRKAL
jgi:hypothetical protein